MEQLLGKFTLQSLRVFALRLKPLDLIHNCHYCKDSESYIMLENQASIPKAAS
jgi:hypothetical protein